MARKARRAILLVDVRQAVVELLRLLGERAAHAAEVLDRLRRRDAVGHAVPDARQDELQQRERALAAGGLGDQQLDRRGIDRMSGVDRRLFDGAAQLGFAHHRHQDGTLGKRVAQRRMPVGGAEEVAAQGQDDRDPRARRAGGVQQVADEGVALRRVVAERIGLLELVDEQDERLGRDLRQQVGDEAQAVERLRTPRVCAQALGELRGLADRRSVAGGDARQHQGQRFDGMAARRDDADARLAAARQGTAGQLGDQSGARER